MKPIEEPNYTQVPNYIMDHLHEFSSEAELKVVLVVARKTFGWHKDRDVISLSQLEAATGMTRSSVVAGLEAALADGWIERVPDGQSFSYAVVVQKLDQSKNHTSPESRPKPVQKVDRELVQKVDTQKKELKKEKKEGEAGKLRQPDPLFDAIVEVCAVDLSVKGSGTTVGTVRAALAGATPPYTPDEVRTWGKEQTWMKHPPTVWQLKSGIGAVRKNGHAKKKGWGMTEEEKAAWNAQNARPKVQP